MPHLEILTKYAIKHAVAFSGVESNAIVEAMEDYALQQTAKYKELVEAYEELTKIQATFGMVGNVMKCREKIEQLKSELK